MGRLIDADKLIAKIEDIYDGYMLSQDGGTVPNDFVEFLEEEPTVEAIPKADYEARLKADMVAMLEELQLEIEETVKEEELIDKNWASGLHYSEKIIQQKIDTLKTESEED